MFQATVTIIAIEIKIEIAVQKTIILMQTWNLQLL